MEPLSKDVRYGRLDRAGKGEGDHRCHVTLRRQATLFCLFPWCDADVEIETVHKESIFQTHWLSRLDQFNLFGIVLIKRC